MTAERIFIFTLLDLIETARLFGAIWFILTLLEVLFPRTRVSWFSRMRGLAFWGICILVWALVSSTFYTFWGQLGVRPLLSPRIETGVTWLDLGIAIVLGNVLADFFFYWRHRAQHAWFWRYHAVHHSIRELSGLGSYNHISEELFRIVLTAIPMSLLLRPQETFLVGIVGNFMGLYLHANTRATLGPLRRVILDPTMHRIHHSIEPAHFDKNFGAFTPLWDVVFGTAYFPRKDEWPETGLPDRPEVEGFKAWLLAPWHRRQPRGNAADGALYLELQRAALVIRSSDR